MRFVSTALVMMAIALMVLALMLLTPTVRANPMTLNAFSAGLLVAATSAGMAQELPRPPELLRTRFCM